MGVLGPQIDTASAFFRRTTNDARILAQRVEMVLDTAAGTYWKNPEYGFAAGDLVNLEITPESFGRIAVAVKAALQADVFFRDATIAVAITAATRRAEGIELSLLATIALPGGEPQRIPIELSAAGVKVGV